MKEVPASSSDLLGRQFNTELIAAEIRNGQKNGLVCVAKMLKKIKMSLKDTAFGQFLESAPVFLN